MVGYPRWYLVTSFYFQAFMLFSFGSFFPLICHHKTLTWIVHYSKVHKHVHSNFPLNIKVQTLLPRCALNPVGKNCNSAEFDDWKCCNYESVRSSLKPPSLQNGYVYKVNKFYYQFLPQQFLPLPSNFVGENISAFHLMFVATWNAIKQAGNVSIKTFLLE